MRRSPYLVVRGVKEGGEKLSQTSPLAKFSVSSTTTITPSPPRYHLQAPAVEQDTVAQERRQRRIRAPCSRFDAVDVNCVGLHPDEVTSRSRRFRCSG
jgi:hypothetical protein